MFFGPFYFDWTILLVLPVFIFCFSGAMYAPVLFFLSYYQ